MARLEWSNSFSNSSNGRGKWCSYKRTMVLVCSINIVFPLFVLHYLYTSLYMYPYNDSVNGENFSFSFFFFFILMDDPFASCYRKVHHFIFLEKDPS